VQSMLKFLYRIPFTARQNENLETEHGTHVFNCQAKAMFDGTYKWLRGEYPEYGVRHKLKSTPKGTHYKTQTLRLTGSIARFATMGFVLRRCSMVSEYVKAKWGKCYALPYMRRSTGRPDEIFATMLLCITRGEKTLNDLLHDTPRKGTRQKTQQTAFGRLVAIKDVWWFRPEMGGLARIFNCGIWCS